jgi:DNA-binding NarL/FixJ family response regulator
LHVYKKNTHLSIFLVKKNKTTTKETKTEEIKLSKRETEILEHLSKGLKYSDIANNLIISPATVRKHIENIYKKLHVHNKMEAVIKARQHKLI